MAQRSRSAPSRISRTGRARLVEGLRTLLKGGTAAPADQQSIIVRCALPHGHVAAVPGTLREIGLDRILGPGGNRPRDLVIAMIVARLIAPASKLAMARMLDPATATSSLGDVLGLGAVDEDHLYAAIDWLGERQQAIEKALARKHLRDGALVLRPRAFGFERWLVRHPFVSALSVIIASCRCGALSLVPTKEVFEWTGRQVTSPN